MVQLSPNGARDDRALERKREILQAASAIFRERGFHATGMRDIAAALEVAVGKLYYWFDSKQKLLAFCQEDCLSRLLSMAEEVTKRQLLPSERVYLLLAGHIRCLNEGTPGSLAHLEVESLAPEDRKRVVALRDRYERVLREEISAGVAAGVFQVADVKLAALGLLGSVNWTVKWYRPEGDVPLGRIEMQLAEQLTRGLLAPGQSLNGGDLMKRIETEGASES